ncbi:MAG TPA: hypothetical protein P5136_01000 [Methanofastidiosum sp.]|nr:hypothetical protein [Methanofastidiosum sp.]
MKYLFLFMIIFLGGCFQEGSYVEEKTNERMSEFDPNKRCIEGHVFYYITSAYGDALAGKFDDDGKPVKCSKKEIEHEK